MNASSVSEARAGSTGSTPERLRLARQPLLGLAGLVLVAPVAILVAFGFGGAEPTLLVLAPLTTFGLPVLAMIAFWWKDWPGTSLGPGWSGLVDTLVVAAGAVVLTMVGQIVVGRLDIPAIFDPTLRTGHVTTFPTIMPLGGAAFVAMLQITLVSEGWPLRGFGRRVGGAAAVLLAWAVAILIFLSVCDFHPPQGSGLIDRRGLLAGGDLGAILVLAGALQVWLFVVWKGWPFAELGQRAVRLALANMVVIGGAAASYAGLRALLSGDTGAMGAAAGTFIAAGLLVGMLFEGYADTVLRSRGARATTLGLVVLISLALYFSLRTYADRLVWLTASADDWIEHAALNGIGLGVILHVAIGRRWPFAEQITSPTRARRCEFER